MNKYTINKEMMAAVAWAGMIILVALGASFAHRQGYIDGDTKLRVLAMNGLWLIYYGNRLPKAVVPGAYASRARRVTGWAMVLSGFFYTGLWAFAPIPVASTVGTGAVVVGSAVTLGYCLSMRGKPKAV